MATETVMALWVLAHKDLFNIKTTILTWPKKLGFSLWDIQVQMTFEGRHYFGRGSGPSEEKAFTKALCEAIERISLQQHGFSTSNGMACHLDLAKAKQFAAFELIERDLFFCHFFSQTPFLLFSQHHLSQLHLPLFQSLQKYPHLREITFRVYNLGECPEWNTVLVCAFGENHSQPFGFVFGSSCKENLTQAIESATVESLRHLMFVLQADRNQILMTEELFQQKNHWSFEDHGHLALDMNYFEKIRHLFPLTESPYSPPNIFLPRMEDISFQELTFVPAPFHVVKASSSSLQDLFLGPTIPEKYNIQRIKQFRFDASLDVSLDASLDASKDFLCITHPFN
jgi:ribosomal protein S12 methylthiotransferase accessory factor YcaO